MNETGVMNIPGTSPETNALNDSALDRNSVGYLMSRTLVTIQAAEPIINAYRTMTRYRIGGLIVLEGSKVYGILTDQVLITCASRKTNPRTEIRAVCRPALKVKPEMSVQEAIEHLRLHHARYLLVIDEHDAPAGLISQTDLLEASLRLLCQAEIDRDIAETRARTDNLTGLFTRDFFDGILNFEVDQASQYSGLLALILIDLDHFKHVNDTHGHAAGDAVLSALGDIIQERIRPIDVACRYGGEEFLILMPGSGTRAAAILTESIADELRDMRFSGVGRPFRVTLSAGICKWTGWLASPEEMVKEADRCLYTAKQSGRDRFEITAEA